MAYETGTAENSRDLLKRLITFVTTNSELVGLSQNWTINTGRISDQAHKYLSNSLVEEEGLVQWDAAVAMGWEDTFNDVNVDDHHYGWSSYMLDVPGTHLGFESVLPVQPTYYKITAINWSTGTDLSTRAPSSWDVEYSDDNILWTPYAADKVTGQTNWSSSEVRQFSITVPAAHKYWRLSFLDNNEDPTILELGRLRFYDITDAWISYSYTTEYQLKAPGLSGLDSIHLRLRMYEDPVADYYNLQLLGSIGYKPEEVFKDQPYSVLETYVQGWQFSIPYWLVANGQRAIMVWKVSTTFHCIYLGKYFPYATPSQVPYPVIVSGSSETSTMRWSHGDTTNSHIQDSSYGGRIFTTDNTWALLRNKFMSYGVDAYLSGAGYVISSPTCNQSLGVTNGVSNVLPNPDGTFTLLPYTLMTLDQPTKNVLGELDGLFWVTGNSNSSENIITIDAQEYLVFQNIYRTDWRDYAALELK